MKSNTITNHDKSREAIEGRRLINGRYIPLPYKCVDCDQEARYTDNLYTWRCAKHWELYAKEKH